jgi:hypothetical protein
LQQVLHDEIGTERTSEHTTHERSVAIPDHRNRVRVTARRGLNELGVAETFCGKAGYLP